jgi:hypothetical protein
MALLTMLMSRRRVLLGLLVLPVGVMVGRLQVMVCGGVVVCSGLPMMLNGRVFLLLCHGPVLLQGIGGSLGASRAKTGLGDDSVSELVTKVPASLRESVARPLSCLSQSRCASAATERAIIAGNR